MTAVNVFEVIVPNITRPLGRRFALIGGRPVEVNAKIRARIATGTASTPMATFSKIPFFSAVTSLWSLL